MVLYHVVAEFFLLVACVLTSNVAVALAPPPDLMVTGNRFFQASTNGLSRLLTQRAVQQVMFYQGVQNDEVMLRWLGEYGQPEPGFCLGPDFHGVDALPLPSSAAYVCGLLALPKTLLSVRRPARRPPGGSRNNPYTQDAAYDDVAVAVNGPCLADGILNMRAIVAQEWSQDLHLFVAEERALRRRHQTTMRAGAVGSAANDEAATRNAADSLPAFEVGRLGTAEGKRSSPFRLASYDLLKLLATRTAMDRVLLAEHGDLLSNDSSRHWLSRFWAERRGGFHGHATWTQGDGEPGAADSLVSALFNAVPTIVTTESGETVLVDPSCLAETLLTARTNIAKEWAEALELVEDEHQCWKQWNTDLIT